MIDGDLAVLDGHRGSLASLVPMHLGTLHGFEAVLLAFLALGPFVLLTVVVVIQGRGMAQAPYEGADQPPEGASADTAQLQG